MKKDFIAIKKGRIFMYSLAFFIIFVLTGCNGLPFDIATGKNTPNFESTESNIVYVPETEEYAYSSVDDLTYTSPLKYEYRNFLSEQGKMYYDAFSNYSWKLTYLYYFENYIDCDRISTYRAKDFYNLDHPESELIEYQIDARSYDTPFCEIAIWGQQENDLAQKQEYETKLREIDAEIADLVNEVNNEDDLVTKYRLIYDYLTTTVEYNFDEYDPRKEENGTYCEDNHTIYGALVKKKAVCDGISDAFKYICNKCNLECVTMRGDLDSTIDSDISHQWNIIPINGNWFLVDCTFDLKTSDTGISTFYWSVDEGTGFMTLKSRLCYFLYNDITVEGRTPYKTVPVSDSLQYDRYVYGYKSSEYPNTSYPKLTPIVNSENTNTLYTEEGVSFTCDENFNLYASTSNVTFALTSEAFEILAQNNFKYTFDDINISTNAKIVGAMYFDGENLYKVDKYNVQDLEVSFNVSDSSVYINNFILLVEYQNKIYQIKFELTGA